MEFNNLPLICFVDIYGRPNLDNALYENSPHTIRQALHKYLKLFVEKSTSKQTVTDFLSVCSELLPQPNYLPTTFPQLKSWLKEETLPVQKMHVCINDCVFFKDKTVEACPRCKENRYTIDSLQRKVARKCFSFCSLSDSLQNLFSCTNISKIMQAAGGKVTLNVKDIKETSIWSSWMNDEDIDEDGCVKIILGFNTDGAYAGSCPADRSFTQF